MYVLEWICFLICICCYLRESVVFFLSNILLYFDDVLPKLESYILQRVLLFFRSLGPILSNVILMFFWILGHMFSNIFWCSSEAWVLYSSTYFDVLPKLGVPYSLTLFWCSSESWVTCSPTYFGVLQKLVSIFYNVFWCCSSEAWGHMFSNVRCVLMTSFKSL